MKRNDVVRGFSLIEMLIASTLVSLSFLAVIQTTLYINEQIRAQWLLADFQQRIRSVDLWMRTHLMLAGYPGCRQYNVQHHCANTKLDYSGKSFPQFSLLSSDAEKTALPPLILSRAVPQSDIIVMSYISPVSVEAVVPISPTQWSVTLPSENTVQQFYFIDNCRNGVFAQIFKTGKGRGKSLLTDVKTRPAGMMPPFYIGEWIRELIYVGYSSQVNQSHDPITALST